MENVISIGDVSILLQVEKIIIKDEEVTILHEAIKNPEAVFNRLVRMAENTTGYLSDILWEAAGAIMDSCL